MFNHSKYIENAGAHREIFLHVFLPLQRAHFFQMIFAIGT